PGGRERRAGRASRGRAASSTRPRRRERAGGRAIRGRRAAASRTSSLQGPVGDEEGGEGQDPQGCERVRPAVPRDGGLVGGARSFARGGAGQVGFARVGEVAGGGEKEPVALAHLEEPRPRRRPEERAPRGRQDDAA